MKPEWGSRLRALAPASGSTMMRPPSVAGRKMAERAGAGRLSAGRDDLRHRRMLVGKPVGRIEAVVDLRLSVLLRASGHLFLHDPVSRRGLGRGRVGPIRILRRDRKPGKQDHRQDTGWNFHACLLFSARSDATLP